MVANISNIQQVYNTIPSRFIFEDVTYDNYQLLTDLHYNHGWRNVIIPEITQFQILGNDYILLDDIVTKLVIDLTPEEIAEQQVEVLKQKETDLYIKRMQDAQRIWAGLSAEFRIAKQVGQMDDATENIILAELKPVLDIVVPFGQWKTGYQLLLGIGSSVIGQELYNKLHDILWNYIQENYEEKEVSELKQTIDKL